MLYMLSLPTEYIVFEYARWEYFDKELNPLKKREFTGYLNLIKTEDSYSQEEFVVRHLRFIKVVRQVRDTQEELLTVIKRVNFKIINNSFLINSSNAKGISEEQREKLLSCVDPLYNNLGEVYTTKDYHFWEDMYIKLGVI